MASLFFLKPDSAYLFSSVHPLQTGMRSTRQATMGDTIIKAAASPPPSPLAIIEPSKSMLFASVYPLGEPGRTSFFFVYSPPPLLIGPFASFCIPGHARASGRLFLSFGGRAGGHACAYPPPMQPCQCRLFRKGGVACALLETYGSVARLCRRLAPNRTIKPLLVRSEQSFRQSAVRRLPTNFVAEKDSPFCRPMT